VAKPISEEKKSSEYNILLVGDALFHADGTDGRKDGHDKANSCYSLCDASITESENKKGESNQEKNKNKCIK
jgi:hypothetical protein